VVQSVASRYTDWAIPAPKHKGVQKSKIYSKVLYSVSIELHPRSFKTNVVKCLHEPFTTYAKKFSAVQIQIGALEKMLTRISGSLIKNVQRKLERVLLKIQIQYRLLTLFHSTDAYVKKKIMNS
jgi:hypothetical protein